MSEAATAAPAEDQQQQQPQEEVTAALPAAEHPDAGAIDVAADGNVTAAATPAAPAPPPSSTPHHPPHYHHSQQQHVSHHHSRDDGQFATPKVFAAPITTPPSMLGEGSRARARPNTASSSSRGGAVVALGGMRRRTKITNASQNASGRNSPSNPGWRRSESPTNTNAEGGSGRTRPHSSPGGGGRRPSPTGLLHGDRVELQPRQQHSSAATVAAQHHHHEHWAVGSPGRAAAEEATMRDQVYSGSPRRSEEPPSFSSSNNNNNNNNNQHQSYYASLQYRSPRPSIPGAHAMMAAGGVVRGRAFMGEAALRPSSASSQHSSGRPRSGGRRSSQGGSPRGLVFPPRKVITAELSALRHKLSSASGDGRSSGSSHSQQHHYQQQTNNSRPATGDHHDGNVRSPAAIKNQLDSLLQAVDPSNVKQVHDMGDGTNDFSSRIPPQMRYDSVVRRAQETRRLMRKEDKQSKETDRKLRNFQARALVHSTSEMARIKGAAELKEIQDKLVWARMKKDSVDNEIYDLRDKLQHLGK